ncbi:class I SAM-dependent methyltransferase [Paracrocinitomix mangrovi]|uniref:class I SAM-dependent methyltransferase n=1 Tax=Paracrocinitomix mangrovi TaxID=2862509 RepID=UPI001C8E2300|nr:class I SAM-dependent methyltransferase [Paracrocinitomix mangrovi]UKN02780.1 class I SAM-dependent methyltransferase [Paracrocinitomix mangrovi]
MSSEIKLNTDFGYYEVTPKPSEEELRSYYEEKYYQEENATYRSSYSAEELQYFRNKIAQKDHVIESILKKESASLLDVGCGEGFTMDYYFKKGWQVKGIDFSDFGLSSNHPHLADHLIQGNVFDSLNQLEQAGNKYDLIWLDNVLEHVIDPQSLLKSCLNLTNDGGMLVIEVPNDFSKLQKALKESGKIERDYWVALPDHLSYFSKDSLINLCKSVNWNAHKVISDFPIEWFLANEVANYSKNKEVGKYAHQSRIFIENFLNDNSGDMNDLIDFYDAMGKIGQGRQLIGFFTK